MSNKDEIDELNHIGDGRILVTKDELLSLKKKWETEARVNELKLVIPPEQYEDYAKLMGDEMCHICGFNACKFRRLLQERINQLNGDK